MDLHSDGLDRGADVLKARNEIGDFHGDRSNLLADIRVRLRFFRYDLGDNIVCRLDLIED